MSTPLRLLIIEDSEDDALLLERELTKNGYDLDSRRVDTPEALKSALAAKTMVSFMAASINKELNNRLRTLEDTEKQITPALMAGSVGLAVIPGTASDSSDTIQQWCLCRRD
ncbi:MAG: hypothetical protein ACOYL3_06250 [Desulfuromonadaceae bacterium]